MPRPALRRLWLTLHRWLGLGLGLFVAALALLGALLTAARPLDEWAHPQLFRASRTGAPPLALQDVRRTLIDTYGAQSSFTLRPPRKPDDTLWVLVRGPWEGRAYFDPATGRLLGQRGEHEGAYNLLFELHSSLLLGETGPPLLAGLALAYLCLLVSGLVLWWPRRWRLAWLVRWREGWTRTLFDLHRSGGSLLGLFIAVSIASGAYMAWRPLSAAVSGLSGQAVVQPPRVDVSAGAPVSLDDLVARARALYPQGRVGYVQLPDRAERPLRVRLKLPDDPHPNGLTSVWMHPVTGEVLAAYRWDELDVGSRAYSIIYPLHTGDLGGPVHIAFNGLLGLSLAGLGASGAWLWWRRRDRT